MGPNTSEHSSHPKFRIEDKFSGEIHAENTDTGAAFKISIPYADKVTLKSIWLPCQKIIY